MCVGMVAQRFLPSSVCSGRAHVMQSWHVGMWAQKHLTLRSRATRLSIERLSIVYGRITMGEKMSRLEYILEKSNEFLLFNHRKCCHGQTDDKVNEHSELHYTVTILRSYSSFQCVLIGAIWQHTCSCYTKMYVRFPIQFWLSRLPGIGFLVGRGSLSFRCPYRDGRLWQLFHQ